MMIVVVNVMLRAGARVRRRGGITSPRLVGDTAPDTKACARRQRASAFGADDTVGRLLRLASRRQALRRLAPRHAMDRFHGRSHGLGIRLGPAKAAGQPLKKLVDLLAFGELLLLLVRFWIGGIRMVCGHSNLIVDIVGEFMH